MSFDPLTLHGVGADANGYAYVSGWVLKSVDPLGLQTYGTTEEAEWGVPESEGWGEAAPTTHGAGAFELDYIFHNIPRAVRQMAPGEHSDYKGTQSRKAAAAETASVAADVSLGVLDLASPLIPGVGEMNLARRGAQAARVLRSIDASLELTSGSRLLVRGGGFFRGADVSPYVSPYRLYGQQWEGSCVAACSRMLASDVGTEMAEGTWLRLGSMDPINGNALWQGELALQGGGVTQFGYRRPTIPELKLQLREGPAMVGVESKEFGSHALVVDKFQDGRFFIRDPEPGNVGSAYSVSEKHFGEHYGGDAVVNGIDNNPGF